MSDSPSKQHHLAIFASGNGSNAQQICQYFSHHPQIDVACIIYNKKDAYVRERANQLGVEACYFPNSVIQTTSELDSTLTQRGVDYIILAGFLSLIPSRLLEQYSDSIINIHPSLLPKFGGKGMYGHHVHQAVIDSHETQSGITIHLVNHKYDDGAILFQAHCPVTSTDTPDTLAHKIHLLEKTFFPQVIESYIIGNPMPTQN